MATVVKYGKVEFSQEDLQFIKDNFQKMTNQSIAKALGVKSTVLRMKAYSMGLQKMELEPWSPEAVTYLKENYKSKGNKQIASELNVISPKRKGWSHRHIIKKMVQLGLKRNFQDQWIVKEKNRQNRSLGKPNPTSQNPEMPRVWIWINAKTRVEVKPGQDIAEVKKKYQHLNATTK
ncbi:MAG: hypothetical protein C4K58_06795 [Flavobacteriaceae bacterium]|nr:MAG: hypothetical protein C4K58_06795 [Flavobacteriaceae bacterium]